MVNTSRWDTGLQAHGITGKFEWTGSVAAGSLSDPRFRDNNSGRHYAGRVVARPTPALAFGASASRGAWLNRNIDDAIAGTNSGNRRRCQPSRRADAARSARCADPWSPGRARVRRRPLAARFPDTPHRADTRWCRALRARLAPPRPAVARAASERSSSCRGPMATTGSAETNSFEVFHLLSNSFQLLLDRHHILQHHRDRGVRNRVAHALAR